MADEKTREGTPGSTKLALEKTMLAHERTLMVWVSTAISMISFGFTIYKFFQETGNNKKQKDYYVPGWWA